MRPHPTPILAALTCLVATLASGAEAQAFGGVLTPDPPRTLYFLAGAGVMAGVAAPFFVHASNLGEDDALGWQVGGTAAGLAANVLVVGLCFVVEHELSDEERGGASRRTVVAEAGPSGVVLTLRF